MGKIMEENYTKGILNRSNVLSENVDALRNCIKDLYSLDDDNYQNIKRLIRLNDDTNNRIDQLTKSVKSMYVRRGVGVLLITGLTYVGSELFRAYRRKIHDLEARIEELEGPGKTEESDG